MMCRRKSLCARPAHALDRKLDDAKKIWEDLALDEGMAVAQEAKVRLGEIAGSAK